MDYHSVSNTGLEKPTGIDGVYISSLKSNEYNSSNNKSLDVVFQPNGDSYHTLVDDDIGYDISNIPRKSSNDNMIESDDKSSYDVFHIGDNPINQFFIASVTVVGLFVLYRMLQKK
jgi:hypothetical protein